MDKCKRVVITGMCIVSPIGNNVKTVQNSLLNNVSGIVFAPKYNEMGFRSQVHGEINIDFEDFLDKKGTFFDNL